MWWWWLWWDGGDDDDGGVVVTMMMMMKMIDMYVDKQQMSLYHDSIIVSCVSYSENTFSHRLIAFLDGLSYPVDDDDVIVIIIIILIM